jgi:hypothetical protein
VCECKDDADAREEPRFVQAGAGVLFAPDDGRCVRRRS